MAFGFLQRGPLTEHARQVQLSSYEPSIQLEGLVRGVDNVRHDVALSARFMEAARQHIFRLITKYGQIESLIEEPSATGRPATRVILPAAGKASESSDLKSALLGLHVAALNRAKAENSISVDLLARLAIVKFQRNEMAAQF